MGTNDFPGSGLRDAFASADSSTRKVVGFFDQVGSTRMKEELPQAGWLPQLGWLYDIVSDATGKYLTAPTVKYLGDGIMVVADDDEATAMVNMAIYVQEALSDAGRAQNGAQAKINFSCTVGIATGEVVGFLTPAGTPDFVGSVVDKARRLCDAASPQAIFVDRGTEQACNMTRLTSRLGSAIGRSTGEYQGDLQRAPLKGFSGPVEYYEVLWGMQLYGLKSNTVTDTANRLQSRATAQSTSQPGPMVRQTGGPKARSERLQGRVTSMKEGFAFAKEGTTGEDFHLTRHRFVYGEDYDKVEVGTRLVFTSRTDHPSATNRHRPGEAVLVVGEDAEGKLVSRPEGKGYGWIRVEGREGAYQFVFLANAGSFTVGQTLCFRVDANEHGASALEVEAAEDEAA